MSRGTKKDDASASPIKRVIALVTPIVDWVRRQRPMRVLTHLSDRDGSLLAAGMSYQSIFAVFAAVWVFFSVSGLLLKSSPTLTGALIHSINQAVPRLIGAGGAIDPSLLLNGPALSWTGAIALIGLFWTAVGWMNSTRLAVRAIFDLGRDSRNFLLQKAIDLGLALGFGVLLILSAVLTIVTGAALGFVFSWLGLDSSSFWAAAAARLLGFALAVALNAVVLATMYRVLSHVLIPFRDLATGSLLGAIALVIMSGLSGLLLGGAGRNPLLASFAAFVGLLIWFNLICQVILLAASWIAVGMADRGVPPKDARESGAGREAPGREAPTAVGTPR
jgi:Predicted membrane protein